MGKLETLEQEIKMLTASELSQFRAWFAQFDAAAWDKQVERDIGAGKLDNLARQAMAAHAGGKTKPL